jgi:hypothetical protein
VDAHAEPLPRAVFAIGALADREQLDDAVHLLGGLDVGRGDLGDALAVDVRPATRVWKARLARMAALAAASKPSTSAVGSASA